MFSENMRKEEQNKKEMVEGPEIDLWFNILKPSYVNFQCLPRDFALILCRAKQGELLLSKYNSFSYDCSTYWVHQTS